MSDKPLKVIDIFEKSVCGVCGGEEINQYYNIKENYIEYCGAFLSLREILSESLDMKIDHDSAKTMVICLDCKNKVIKFYHFKKQVKKAQKNHRIAKVQFEKHQINEKPTKVVHNIYKIIESYAEKFSVAAIRVEEGSKKLIIEPDDVEQLTNQENTETVEIKQEPESYIFEDYHEQFPISDGTSFSDDLSRSNCESVILVKEEPNEFSDIIFQNIVDNCIVNSPQSSSSFQAQPSLPIAQKRTSSLNDIIRLQPISIHQQSSTKSSKPVKKIQQAFKHRPRNNRSNEPISTAAMKMRMYREKLKKPENRDKFLQHKQKQKEWNRNYYQRKLMKDMLSGNEMDQFMYS